MLTIRNVNKQFDGTPVLNNVSLSVNKGDVIAIIGQSGGGKTTLLRCMNFLETADSGEMEFDGACFDLRHISARQIARIRRKTAFVFQGYNLFRNKTALQNVMLGLTVARKMPKKQAEEIARALATKPEIIYFDEPTSALDPELTGEVLSVMRRLAEEGMTMLVVTHELGFARNVSTKTMFMDKGTVVESGPSAELFANPKEERTRAFLNTITQHEKE